MAGDRSQDERLAHAKGPELAGPPLSLRCMLDDVVSRHPERDAVVSMYQHSIAETSVKEPRHSSDVPLRYSFGHLQRDSDSLAVALYRDYGLRAGRPMVVFLYNCAEFAVAIWTAARLNVPIVPVLPTMLASPAELQHCFKIIQPAVLVADASLIQGIESALDLNGIPLILKIVTSETQDPIAGWVHWKDVARPCERADAVSTLAEVNKQSIDIENDIASMILTSGTSGMPKICAHTNKTLWAGCMGSGWLRGVQKEHVLLQQIPASHVFGLINMLAFWVVGASVVFPSRVFDAAKSLRAMEVEMCTHTSAVPTIIKALVSQPEFSPQKTKSLQHISLGGTVISSEIVQICQDTSARGLGVKLAAVGFGMSEGVPTLGWHHTVKPMVEQGFTSVGKPVPGARVKICRPGTRTPVSLDEIGELHVGGPMIISGYIASDNSAFYDDAGCHWLATGDQASLNGSGAVFILGRYKDLIIRAGENIAPSKIEACVGHALPSISCQVVGIPDDLAGEVPAAILDVPDGLRPDIDWVKSLVIESLGLSHSLEMVITLRDLGLDGFPVTSSGKTKKYELRDRLLQHLKTSDQGSQSKTSSAKLSESAILLILGRLLGLKEAQIPRKRALTDLLDSIAIMRFCDEVRKSYHVEISIKDVQDASDIAALAKIIGTPESKNADRTNVTDHSRIDDISDYLEDEHATIQRQMKPVLERLGLNWAEDVEGLSPLAGTASFAWAREIPFSHQLTYITKVSDKSLLRSIITSSLESWPVFRSLCTGMDASTRLWVVLRNTQKFSKLAISLHDDVEDLEELSKLSISHDHKAGQFPEHVLFRAIVTNVKSIGAAGAVILVHHAAYDFLSMFEWRNDFEAQLTGLAVARRPSFTQFSKLYYLYRDSLPAQRSIAFHVDLLTGLSNHRKALWPPHATSFVPQKSSPAVQEALQGKRTQVPISARKGDLTHYIRIPSLPMIASQHGVKPPVLVRTAIALFNVIQTGHSHALFVMLMAGRTWPFITSEIADHLPNPLHIAGPTFTAVTSLLKIDPKASIQSLLELASEQQINLNKYQHVPLSMQTQLSQSDREVWIEAKRQFCNWTPPVWPRINVKDSGLKLVSMDGYEGHESTGYIWECGMKDHETVRLRAQWSRKVFCDEEVNSFLVTVAQIIECLGNVGQWHLTVGEVLSSMTSGQWSAKD